MFKRPPDETLENTSQKYKKKNPTSLKGRRAG
jgi:hypothetical protein